MSEVTEFPFVCTSHKGILFGDFIDKFIGAVKHHETLGAVVAVYREDGVYLDLRVDDVKAGHALLYLLERAKDEIACRIMDIEDEEGK
jgi:hypothetical protein